MDGTQVARDLNAKATSATDQLRSRGLLSLLKAEMNT